VSLLEAAEDMNLRGRSPLEDLDDEDVSPAVAARAAQAQWVERMHDLGWREWRSVTGLREPTHYSPDSTTGPSVRPTSLIAVG
jgi:hypothetical protein